MSAEEPYVGRGGWTWYTGSAGWMYRAGLESILGLKVAGTRLDIEPCLPPEWDRVDVRYRFGGASYQIAIEADCAVPRRVGQVIVDGRDEPTLRLRLEDDGGTHRVTVRMVTRAPAG